jgi:hypothetical protein
MLCKNCNTEIKIAKKQTGRQIYCFPKCRLDYWQKHHRIRVKEYAKRYNLKHPPLCKICKSPIPENERKSGVCFCSDTCRDISRTNVDKAFRNRRRLAVFKMLGGAICVNCGCSDIRLLEINHKHGGGAREYRSGAGVRLVEDIYYNRRNKNDFDVRCRVCNNLYYLILKYPDVEGCYMVKYQSRIEQEKIEKNGDV